MTNFKAIVSSVALLVMLIIASSVYAHRDGCHRRAPLLIAQAGLDISYVIRVVYRKERDRIVIITFIQAEKSNMKKNSLKISYDPEADVMSWELSKRGKIDYATEMGDFIVHFSKDDTPVLIEALDASKLLMKSEKLVEKTRELAMSH